MSFLTTRVGNVFSGSDTAPGATYYDMNNNDYVQREIMKMTFADTEDESALFALLAYLTGVGQKHATKSKAPQWVIGDGEVRTVYLDTATTIPAAGSTVAIAFQESDLATAVTHISNNQMFYLYETDVDGAGVTYARAAIVKYNSTTGLATTIARSAVGPLAAGYDDNARNGVDAGGASADYTFSDELQIVVLPTNMPYDGTVGSAIEYAPYFIDNVMQRIREAVEIGSHTHSDNLLYQGDINTQARIKWKSLAEKVNFQLHTSARKQATSSAINGSATFAGFPGFYRPDGTSVTDINGNAISGMHGHNKVIESNTIDFDTLEDLMRHYRKHGSKDKIFVMPGHIMTRFTKMARAMQVLNANSMYSFPEFPDVTVSMPSIKTAFGTAWLMLDDGMEGLSIGVVDSDDAETVALGGNFCLVVDPTQIKFLTHIVDNGPDAGAQDFRLKPVTLSENNNSIVKMEWDATKSLYCGDPRSGGYIAWTS